MIPIHFIIGMTFLSSFLSLIFRTYGSSGDSGNGISYNPTTRSRSSTSYRSGSGGAMVPMSGGGSSNVIRTTTISYGSKVCQSKSFIVVNWFYFDLRIKCLNK